MKNKDYFFKDNPENILTKLLSERFVKIKRTTIKEEVKTEYEINESQIKVNKNEIKKNEKNDDEKKSEGSEENEKNKESEENEENEESEKNEESEESKENEESEKNKYKFKKNRNKSINFNDFSYEEIKKLEKSGILTLEQLSKCIKRENDLMMKIRYIHKPEND